jgi:Mrp family chromosome partitioning ATPase/capsular polysaccharide biosynthesis protein
VGGLPREERATPSQPLALAFLAVLAFLIAGGAAFIVSSSREGIFEARAFLAEATTERLLGPGTDVTATTRQRLELYARSAESQAVLERSIDRLDLDMSWVELASQLEASVSENATWIAVAVEDRDPALASALANVIAQEIIASSSTDAGNASALTVEIDAELQARLERIARLQARIDRLSNIDDPSGRQRRRLRSLVASLTATPRIYAQLLPYSSEGSAGALIVTEPAVTPTTPVEPVPMLDGILAGFVGVIMVLPLVAVPSFLRSAISTPDDVRDETQLATLAIVPRVPGDGRRPSLSRQAVLVAPGSSAADAYRRISLALELWSPALEQRMFLMASPRRTEAKSVAAANVALAIAQAGRQVILVDADLDHPSAHRMFGISNGPGLAESLAGDIDDPADVLVPTPLPALRILTAGDARSHLREHIGSTSMKRVLLRLRADHDIVIDAPPLRDNAAGEILGPEADGVVLALELGRSRRTEARDVADALRRTGAQVVGAMLIQPRPRLLGGVLGRIPGRGEPTPSATAAPSWPQATMPPGGWQPTSAHGAANRSSSLPGVPDEPEVGPYFIPPEGPDHAQPGERR